MGGVDDKQPRATIRIGGWAEWVMDLNHVLLFGMSDIGVTRAGT